MKRSHPTKSIIQVNRRNGGLVGAVSMLRAGRLPFFPDKHDTKGCGITMEDSFNRILCLERRRSERTGDPFVLMIMELDQLLPHISPGALKDLCTAMRTDTRETDFIGWYQYPTAIGMIFTALREVNRKSALVALTDRTNRALSRALDSEVRKKVCVSFHLFPEDKAMGDPTSGSDEKLYPDLKKRDAAEILQDSIKRLVDIAGSLTTLIFSAPMFVAIAALIKLTSKGPVFFHQKRIGRFGKAFDLLKFRTMYVNSDHHIHQEFVQNFILQADSSAAAEDKSGTVYKIVNDPRVTPIGSLLRKTSIDELPQLINVLKGEMSLVGPRPPILYEVAYYRHWHKRRVIEAKPGITGLWQVNGRSKTTFDEMVRLDLRYVRLQSIWLDLKILFRTPLAVLTGSGAY